MLIVTYVFSIVFALLAAALLFTWYRQRHSGALMLAVTYATTAALTLMFQT